jgi:hypothetical protein
VLCFEIPAAIHDGMIYGYFYDAIQILDVWDEVGRIPRFTERSRGRLSLGTAQYIGNANYRYEFYWNRWFLPSGSFGCDGIETQSTVFYIASGTKMLLIKYRFRMPSKESDIERYLLWVDWDVGVKGFAGYESMALEMFKSGRTEEEATLPGDFDSNFGGTFTGISEFQERLYYEREILRNQKRVLADGETK